jgi:hypothetical protein
MHVTIGNVVVAPYMYISTLVFTAGLEKYVSVMLLDWEETQI